MSKHNLIILKRFIKISKARKIDLIVILTVAVMAVAFGAIYESGKKHDHKTVHAAEESIENDGQMPMIEATEPESYTAQVDYLPKTGWIASSTDANSNYPASNVLDGKLNTIWHTTRTPLPHSITIDMRTSRGISGLRYYPRQDNSLNGTIGQYKIETSLNGTHWGAIVASGTWANNKNSKTARFPVVYARYVRLTALTEAGNRGPWSSAAEIDIIGEVMPNPALSRVGWTARASDYNLETSESASKVLDGDAGTTWHSQYSPILKPLPHSITIDMKANKTVTGLSYLPRQDGSKNGNIGSYSISVSKDGTTWGTPVASGKWGDTSAQKFASFTKTTARFVRLTANSEAGNRGPWSSASEINILTTPPSIGTGGKWSQPIGLPIVPVSGIVLPNNKLLMFAGYNDTSFNIGASVTRVTILDLSTNKPSQAQDINTNHQMFCEGLSILSDGRVLIVGGSSDSRTTIYDPYANTWTAGPQLNIPRAYQGDTTLSTGQVLTIGGSWADGAGGKTGELYTPGVSGGSWALLPGVSASNILTADPGGVYRADNHAWLFAVGNGGVFHAGPSKQMNWITTSGQGSIASAGLRSDSPDAMNGNATMYDVGKILAVGGSTSYTGRQGSNLAYTMNITGGPNNPVLTNKVSNMHYVRSLASSVVLPDGKVLVLGGQQFSQPFTDTGAALSPELWDPATGKFTVMSPDVIPRTYHNIATLLPDGRVFSGGGGLCGGCTTNHPDGRIFTPPYLLNADGTFRVRPIITNAPTTSNANSTISVTTNKASPRFALVRVSSMTHNLNNDQRRIPLTPVSTNGTTYTLHIPADKGVVLPGPYMLFAMDTNGTPSVSKYILIQ